MSKPVIFVGPLPPPVHGFSVINQAVLQGLEQGGPVEVFNRVRRKGWRGVLQLAGDWSRLTRCLAAKPVGMYLGLSGGLGQILDWPYLLGARLFKIPLTVHHHSFAYIHKPTTVHRLTFELLRTARHIVLCDDMGYKIHAIHNIPHQNIITLSNTAFLEDAPPTPSIIRPEAKIKIGFISNITREKGIFIFFDLLKNLNSNGIECEGVIAGPVQAEIQSKFDSNLRSLPNCKWIGPVYKGEKSQFYQSIDILAFPTQYINEAEPVTIIEAKSHGVSVVAYARGCIDCMLTSGPDLAVPVGEDFTSVAAKFIDQYAASSHKDLQRVKIQESLEQSRRQAQRSLTHLLEKIRSGKKS